MKQEIWKTIEGYEDYEASTFGRVRSIDRDIIDSWGRIYHLHGCILKQAIQTDGAYKQAMVSLRKDRKTKRRIVARVIAETFIPNPNNLPQVNHKNENPLDNRVENLEWCTCQYNINYGDTIKRRAKTKCRAIDVFDKDMNYIETLESGIEASIKYGVSRGLISCCCNNKIKQAKGYIFKFA